MKKTKEILSLVIIITFLFGVFPSQGVYLQTAEAATGDPNFITYKDINIPADGDFYDAGWNYGTMRGTINNQKLTNIKFNRTTKQLTFDLSSDATLTVGVNLVPSQSALDRRVVRAELCVAAIPEGAPLDLPVYQYNCPSHWSNPNTNWTPLYRSFFAGPFDDNRFDHTFNLATDAYGNVLGNLSYGELPIGLVVNYAVGAGQQDSWGGFNPDKGYGGPYIGHTFQKVFPLIPNSPPTISLNTPNNQVLQNEPGRNTLNIEGYVHDPDNDDLIVSAEISNVFYRKTVVSQTKGYQYFSIPVDAVADSIPPGDYTMTVKVADPSNMSESVNMTFKVTNRLKRNAFVLVNSSIENSGTTYEDYEWDAKYADRVRYDHDPNYFDNSMGIIGDSGLWRTSLYTSFPYTGQYVVSYQAKDIPKQDARFAEYQMWSKDAASTMSFKVHRKPIALFSARLINGNVQLIDSSYDLDHITSSDKGIMQWQWQYKKTVNEMWIDGQPPGGVFEKDSYDIRLRVRDVDGDNGVGVWSDWCQRTVGNASVNLPPVALFTVDPNIVSYRKSTTITDKSFDPDNDPLDVYYWTVIKDGWNKVWEHWGGATTPPNIASFGEGNYQLNLQVHDNRGLWSDWYSQNVQVVNHPPAAAFTMPNEIYRDTIITMDNLTPDPDEDGDALSYAWNAKFNDSPYYWAGNNRYQSMTIRDLINRNGISHKKAISDGWEMQLTASDVKLSSYATRTFMVKNHVPVAKINGPSSVNQYDTKQFTSGDIDEDTSDQSSLEYYWKVSNSAGEMKSYLTRDITLTFSDPGVYTLEHWAIDQIGDKSNIAGLQVQVKENLAPTMTLTSPSGTVTNPSVIDAEQGDPLIKWTYADPENDLQEKYRLEFFTKDGLLVSTIENPDPTGLLRQYQIPNNTFERFEYFTVQGRAYSKFSWSDVSNEKTFIIDNAPKPGFTLITDTGKDATKVPIYRTDVLNIKSNATDPDEPKGDTISYKYYLKPSSGTETLASAQKDFTKQFTSNGVFTIRQLVTDSLGLYRELSQNITVVNRIPTATVTYPTSIDPSKPTIASTLTPILKWDYQDEDGDLQQRYKVRIITLATGAIKVQSGEQVSRAKQWQIPAGSLIENEKYAVEVEVFDGFSWSNVSPRKYLMVNLLTIKGGVKHTEEWNNNRKGYNLKKSGNEESPRGYNVFWAGERFVLQGTATGLPDTVQVTMVGGFTTQLSPTNDDKTFWTGEMYDSSFEKLPDGPVTFTFTAQNAYNTKTDTVTVVISSYWSEYFQSHRIK
ncbi:hypothetical protein [Paenibacillus etheri]|uniref:PKD domain-containing protein n=1 Tax=Paenibacillus etheri TaxID=1306852 RepID=A0A0W1AVK1_9BACL|nr:hypothetical protein [Paenibacillus etheri]KTD85366.1 hypothetical protein UQ64_21070 [Paenibacillus etheri]